MSAPRRGKKRPAVDELDALYTLLQRSADVQSLDIAAMCLEGEQCSVSALQYADAAAKARNAHRLAGDLKRDAMHDSMVALTSAAVRDHVNACERAVTEATAMHADVARMCVGFMQFVAIGRHVAELEPPVPTRSNWALRFLHATMDSVNSLLHEWGAVQWRVSGYAPRIVRHNTLGLVAYWTKGETKLILASPHTFYLRSFLEPKPTLQPHELAWRVCKCAPERPMVENTCGVLITRCMDCPFPGRGVPCAVCALPVGDTYGTTGASEGELFPYETVQPSGDVHLCAACISRLSIRGRSISVGIRCSGLVPVYGASPPLRA